MKPEKNYEYKDINTKLLCVDPLYQRKVDMRRVAQMNKDFRPEIVDPIKVSFREGKYWIFDGQHTAELLKLRNRGNDLPVECKVFYGLTWLDECELFLLQRGISRAVGVEDKYKARFNRGDKDVVAIVNIAQDLGIRVDFTKTKGNNRICALTTLDRIFTGLGDDDYREMLSIIRDAWDGDATSFSAEILKGMYIFFKTYKGQFNKKRLISQLHSVSPTVIIREGKASTSPGFSKYARQILNAYNFRTKIRLPDLL